MTDAHTNLLAQSLLQENVLLKPVGTSRPEITLALGCDTIVFAKDNVRCIVRAVNLVCLKLIDVAVID
jgi:hypothetical protein